MRNFFLISLLLLNITSNAQEQTDSMRTLKLNEVVVDATRNYAITDGVVYIPSKEARQHAININDLLARMMVAGLHVDLTTDKVETTYKGEVHFYIDGVEAQDWEVKALRPKDVMHVEYLKSPADPKYKNYQAVVNLVMKKIQVRRIRARRSQPGIYQQQRRLRCCGKDEYRQMDACRYGRSVLPQRQRHNAQPKHAIHIQPG